MTKLTRSPKKVKDSLILWTDPTGLSLRRSLGLGDWFIVMSDASLQGWGGHCHGKMVNSMVHGQTLPICLSAGPLALETGSLLLQMPVSMAGEHIVVERWSALWYTLSNILKLRAPFNVLQVFEPLLRSQKVMLRIDNATTVPNVASQGWTRSMVLLQEATLIWAEPCLKALIASYILGPNNIQASLI